MLSIYIACLAFGGVTLLASMLGGDGHSTGDGPGGGDAHLGGAHADAGPAHAHDAAGHQPGETGFIPFMSLRFWTFGLTFFGLAGVSLHGTGALAGAAAGIAAGAVGVGSGWTAATVLHALTRKRVGRIGPAESHVGREGRLLLPVGKGQRGKLRVGIGDTQVDMIAETEADEALAAGTPVLIVGLHDAVALVERSPSAPRAIEAAAKDEGKEPT